MFGSNASNSTYRPAPLSLESILRGGSSSSIPVQQNPQPVVQNNVEPPVIQEQPVVQPEPIQPTPVQEPIQPIQVQQPVQPIQVQQPVQPVQEPMQQSVPTQVQQPVQPAQEPMQQSDNPFNFASYSKPLVTQNFAAPAQEPQPAPQTTENKMEEVPNKTPTNRESKIIGRVIRKAEDKCIIQGNEEIIDVGTELYHNGEKVGEVVDIFGQITQPFYVVAANLEVNDVVCIMVEKDWKGIDVNTISRYGTDASGMNDMELPEDEREFSDDEEERMAKRMRRTKKTTTEYVIPPNPQIPQSNGMDEVSFD